MLGLAQHVLAQTCSVLACAGYLSVESCQRIKPSTYNCFVKFWHIQFLFKHNRVRIIYDCNASPVRVIQCEELKQPLCLVDSTHCMPHGCHTYYMANIGSIASLVIFVVINNNDSTKLWGLVVC